MHPKRRVQCDALEKPLTLAVSATVVEGDLVVEGNNTGTVAGSYARDLSVVSAYEEDTVDVADTAVTGGETNLSLGEQQDFGGKCRGGRGFGFHGGREIMDSANLHGAARALRFGR